MQCMKTLVNVIFLVAFFSLVLSLPACALSGNAIAGKILEEGTDKPIPNAIVIVLWDGSVPSLADSHSVCVHVDTTVTDSKGNYHFAPWRKRSKFGPVIDVGPVVSAYKAGYEQMLLGEPQSAHLAPFRGERVKRLQYIERLKQATAHCASPNAEGKNLIPLYQALYAEAKSLAQTNNEQDIANGFLSWIKILEHDSGK